MPTFSFDTSSNVVEKFSFLLFVIFVKVLGNTFCSINLQQTGDACGELMLLHMCDEKIKLLLDL